MRKVVLAAMLSLLSLSAAGGAATELSDDAINSASIEGGEAGTQPDPFIIRVQILLDRTHISPGVIDGYLGDNLKKAIRVFEAREGLETDGKIDQKFWAALSNDSAAVLQIYEISPEDLLQRYVEKIPEDYAEMADMKWLGYTGPERNASRALSHGPEPAGAPQPECGLRIRRQQDRCGVDR